MSAPPPNNSEKIVATMRAWLLENVGEAAVLLLPELATMLMEDAPGLMAQLKEAHEAGDRFMVAEMAHSLKGSSASMGLTQFSNVCAAVEAHAKNEGLTGISPKIVRLETEFEQTMTALATIVPAN